ncbi:hypothetical protein [Pelagibius sp. Alg239-R121]|uniref:P-loop ATPase, Sll1717 family n=1 Tax=Pelagibius sp. Alg239-R121 TaxID=2993448 RepID=UPI0024A6F87A|nr:hypothetical protein [Pelagibius sp. Alg239-R121]
MPTFSDENIFKLFGAEAAEDEEPRRLKEWFVRNKAYESIRSDLPIRILVGHKGVGKSALLRMAHFEDLDQGVLSLSLKPNDLHALISLNNDAQFLELIEAWKMGLRRLMILSIAKSYFEPLEGSDTAVKSALGQFGKALASIVERVKNDKIHVADKAILNFAANKTVRVYIDYIDRGWSASKFDIQKVSALINAVRDLINDLREEGCSVHFRIGLRTDVYHLVRTSDESTDKSQSYITWLNWDNHDILILIVKRVEKFFGNEFHEGSWQNKTQIQISQKLQKIMEMRFSGAGKWSNVPVHRVLLSLIRRRPRDLIKLLTSAAQEAHRENSEIITTEHLRSTFEHYSRERLQDIINEFKSELPGIEHLVHGMKPTTQEKKDGLMYFYTQDRLIKKIKNLMSQHKYMFTNKKQCTPKSLAEFLYKIDFITARKGREQSGSKIIRKHFEEHQTLLADFADYGFDWEVHMAYRWALQPDGIEDIFNQIQVPET